MTRLALALAAALSLSAPCTPAYAEPPPRKAPPDANAPPPPCAPLKTHAAYLARRWGERPFAPGRIGGAVVILFVNPAARTWTLVRVVAADFGCAVGAGRLPARAPAHPRARPGPDRSVF